MLKSHKKDVKIPTNLQNIGDIKKRIHKNADAVMSVRPFIFVDGLAVIAQCEVFKKRIIVNMEDFFHGNQFRYAYIIRAAFNLGIDASGNVDAHQLHLGCYLLLGKM